MGLGFGSRHNVACVHQLAVPLHPGISAALPKVSFHTYLSQWHSHCFCPLFQGVILKLIVWTFGHSSLLLDSEDLSTLSFTVSLRLFKSKKTGAWLSWHCPQHTPCLFVDKSSDFLHPGKFWKAKQNPKLAVVAWLLGGQLPFASSSVKVAHLSSDMKNSHWSKGIDVKQTSPKPCSSIPSPSTQEVVWGLYPCHIKKNTEDPFWIFLKCQGFGFLWWGEKSIY